MRSYLALGTVVMAGWLLGGCASKAELDACRAANRKMDEQRKEALAKVDSLQADNDKLNASIQNHNITLDKAQKDLYAMADANDKLRAQLLDLQNKVKGLAEIKPPPGAPTIVLPPQMHQKLQEFAKANPGVVEYLPEYGMVKFKSDLTFEKGQDFVSPAATLALDKFAKILSTPDAAPFYLYVAGHTDDIPIRKHETMVRHPNNWYLSVHRAVAVEEALVKAGVSPERIGVMGFSEYHPVAPNAANGGGNEANRRVEIWIVPRGQFLTGATTSTPAPAPARNPSPAPSPAPSATPTPAPAAPAAPVPVPSGAAPAVAPK